MLLNIKYKNVNLSREIFFIIIFFLVSIKDETIFFFPRPNLFYSVSVADEGFKI